MTAMNFTEVADVRLRRQKKRRRFLIAIVGIIILVAGFFTVWAFGIETGLLTVTSLTVYDDNIPASWDGRVIAFFSDTHVGPAFDAGRLSRVADAINQAEPDLILFGGDLIDSQTPDDDDFAAGISFELARMQAPFGKFAVAGNHDNRLASTLARASGMLSDGGFQLLANESVELDELILGGLEESYFGRPNLEMTFPQKTAEPSIFRILLMHEPDCAAALPRHSANLMLSGHSHNGQVAIFNRPIVTVYQARQYTYGLYDLDDSRQLVVTRGLGTVSIAARFGSPPEIMLITLRRP